MRGDTVRPQCEVFLRGDIANAVRAIDQANAGLARLAAGAPEVVAYRAGFAAALVAVAAAFGVQVALEVVEVPMSGLLRILVEKR